MEDDPMGKQIRGKNAAAKKKTQEKEEKKNKDKKGGKKYQFKIGKYKNLLKHAEELE